MQWRNYGSFEFIGINCFSKIICKRFSLPFVAKKKKKACLSNSDECVCVYLSHTYDNKSALLTKNRGNFSTS